MIKRYLDKVGRVWFAVPRYTYSTDVSARDAELLVVRDEELEFAVRHNIVPFIWSLTDAEFYFGPLVPEGEVTT